MTRTWRVVAALVALGLAVAVLWSTGAWLLAPAEARAAAAGLRTGSAWVAPGQEQVLDVDRAEAVIGDRPLVVVVLAPSYDGDHLDACHAVAQLQPRTIVLAYLGRERGRSPAICSTSRFPEPEGVPESSVDGISKVDSWLFRLSLRADAAAQFRVDEDTADRTPEVEELVLAFDAQAARDYPAGAPTRDAGADPVTWGKVLLQLVGLGLLLTLAFFGLRRLAGLVADRQRVLRARDDRRLELDARLSALAAEVLAPGAGGGRVAEARAQAAESYVLALTAFASARTDEQLDEAEQALVAVDRALART